MSDPFLRPVARPGAAPAPLPPGHRAEPAGRWRGRSMDIVYDPRRHDVAVVSGISDRVRQGMAGAGWQRREAEGGRELWIRDRMALARSRLRQVPTRRDVPRIA